MIRVSRRRSGAVDWGEGRASLARAAKSLDEALSPSPQRSRQVMDERARLLSRVPPDPQTQGSETDALIFSLAEGRYAFETRFVREVIRMGDATAVPGAPDFLHGVVNFRGEILAIVDLRQFLGLRSEFPVDLPQAIVLGEDDAELGVLVDRVHEVAGVAMGELHDPLEAPGRAQRNSIRGITRDAMTVLDGAALLADRRLFLDQTEAPAMPATRKDLNE